MGSRPARPDGATRVLIVKTSSLGDVVHALPAVTDLAGEIPGARIDWLVEEAFADVPPLHSAVSRVIPIAIRRWRRTPFAPATRREVGAVRRTLSERAYTLVVDCQGLIKSALVARWAHAPVAGLDWRSAREPLASLAYARRFTVARSLHAIERNRALVGAALGYAVAGPPRFGIRAPSAGATPAPYAVLLTNASRPTKLWPDDGWREVAALLARRGLALRLYWGTEVERAATAARAQAMPGAQVMPRAPIGAVAADLAAARIVVGLDTGLTHLAAALQVPALGIFCDYDPALVGLVTGGAPCASLGSAHGGPTVASVLSAIETLLEPGA